MATAALKPITTLSGKRVVDHHTLMKQVAIESGIKLDDVHRVLECLWLVIRKNLLLGYRVQVNGLGIFMRMQRYCQALEGNDSGVKKVVTIVKMDKEMVQPRLERL